MFGNRMVFLILVSVAFFASAEQVPVCFDGENGLGWFYRTILCSGFVPSNSILSFGKDLNNPYQPRSGNPASIPDLSSFYLARMDLDWVEPRALAAIRLPGILLWSACSNTF